MGNYCRRISGMTGEREGRGIKARHILVGGNWLALLPGPERSRLIGKYGLLGAYRTQIMPHALPFESCFELVFAVRAVSSQLSRNVAQSRLEIFRTSMRSFIAIDRFCVASTIIM